MKKSTLLFTCLILSCATFSKEVMPEPSEIAPKLKVDSMGTFINYSDLNADVNLSRDFYFYNMRMIGPPPSEDIFSIDTDLKKIEYGITTKLSYGKKWSFNILASETSIKGIGGIVNDIAPGFDLNDRYSSYSSKLIVGAWRNYDNFSLGAEWAHGNNLNDFEFFSTLIGDAWKQDIFSIKGKYNYPLMDGHLLGWTDLKYGVVNDFLTTTASNLISSFGVSEASSHYKYYEVEGMPLAYKYGPITFGYYIKHRKFDNFLDAKMTEQQLRLVADIYSNDKLSIYGEYRYGLKMKVDGGIGPFSLGDAINTKVLDAGDRQQFILGAKYAINENLILDANVSYQTLKYNIDGPALYYNDLSIDNKFKETKVGVSLTYMF